MTGLPRNLRRKTCLLSSAMGMFLCAAIPALGEEKSNEVPLSVSECENVKKRFLESEIPTSADAEKFVACFHIDITSGTATPIIDEDHPKHEEGCTKKSNNPDVECLDPPQG